MVDECLDEVNERSTQIVTVTFRDEDDVLVVPTSATYRLDDKQRRTVIRDDTAIGSLANSVDIEILPEENRIIRPRSIYEIRTLTVHYEWGSGRAANSEYRYKVINLYGVNPFGSPSVSPSASASPST